MKLYPQLPFAIAKRLSEEYATLSTLELESRSQLEWRESIRSATGGTSATVQDLKDLQSAIRAVGKKHGYVYGAEEQTSLDARTKAAFDAALARCMYTHFKTTATEAIRGGVWCFIGCAVAPELVRWRFPGQEMTSVDRFRTKRLRNMYGRVWWRALLLCDEADDDPLWLLDELGEDELVQITERGNAAGYRPLVVVLARTLVTTWSADLGVNRPLILREAMKRLVRLLPLLRFEMLDEEGLQCVVDEIYSGVWAGLGVERPFGVESVVPEAWWHSRRWQDCALDRRFMVVEALTGAQVSSLADMRDPTRSSNGEYEARWSLASQLVGELGDIVEVCGPIRSPVDEARDVWAWLAEGESGSWASRVQGRRGRRLVNALGEKEAKGVFEAVGWRWGNTTWSEAQRTIRRQYNGDWEVMVSAFTAERLVSVAPMLGVEIERAHAHRNVARWLLADDSLEWRTSGDAGVDTVDVDGVIGEVDAELELDAALQGGPEEGHSEDEPPADEPPADEPPADEHSEDESPEDEYPEDDDTTEEVVNRVVGEDSSLEVVSSEWRSERIPEPPGLIRNILVSSGVHNLGDLDDLNVDSVGQLRGVGPGKVRALVKWRDEVFDGNRRLITQPGWNDIVRRPWFDEACPEPPTLLRTTLRRASVRTAGDLAALTREELGAMVSVGPKKLEELLRWRVEVLPEGWQVYAAGRVPKIVDPVVEPPESMDELQDRLRAHWTERQRKVVELRYVRNVSLKRVGDELGLSRERARQLIRGAMDDARVALGLRGGATAATLLGLDPGVSVVLLPGEQVEHREYLRLVVVLLTEAKWIWIDDQFLWCGSTLTFSETLAALRDALAGRAQAADDSLVAIALEMGLPLVDVQYLLLRRLGWVRSEDGWRVDETRLPTNEWMIWRLRREGGPMHQSLIVSLMAYRMRALGEQPNEARLLRSVEGILIRHPQVLRCDRGTFVHTDSVPISALDKLADRCVQLLDGENGAWGVEPLLLRLDAEGYDTDGVNAYLLKDWLVRRPEILTLRKGHVAFAATYDEAGMLLDDRIARVLAAAGRPLTADEVVAGMPASTSYADVSIRSMLSTSDRFKQESWGRWVVSE